MSENAKPKAAAGWLNLVVDYAPIAVFFLVYKHYSPADRGNAVGEVLAVIRGTLSFMVAAVVALVVSKWKLGRISPMLWLSTALIVGFGGLTVIFQDARFIQIKPTLIYLIFAAVLLGGAARGKAMLKILLEAAFEGLNEVGWLKLSRRWGWFFIFLAGLNEVTRYYFNQQNGNLGTWIAMKIWLFLPLTFLFTFTQVPMLLRHGLAEQAKDEVLTDPPHE